MIPFSRNFIYFPFIRFLIVLKCTIEFVFDPSALIMTNIIPVTAVSLLKRLMLSVSRILFQCSVSYNISIIIFLLTQIIRVALK